MPENSKENIIYHKGLREEQEYPNSFEALRATHGAAIETDVMLLKDGSLAIIHNKDYGLSEEAVEKMELSELENIDVTSSSGETQGSKVPLFKEYVASSFDRGIDLNIEIKGSSTAMAEKNTSLIIEQFAEMHTDWVFEDQSDYPSKSLQISSLSIEAVQQAKQELADKKIDIPIGLRWTSSPEKAYEAEITKSAIEKVKALETSNPDWTLNGIEIAHQIGCTSIDLHGNVITQEVILKAHKKKLKVFAWGVYDDEKIKELTELGVDKIIFEPKKR